MVRLGRACKTGLRQWIATVRAKNAKPGLFYERQLATFQQYVVLHAPDSSQATLEAADGRDDLGRALLMTAEQMMNRGGSEADPIHNLECRIQDQIRMSVRPAMVYAGRALHFYQLRSRNKVSEVAEYLRLFELASGVSAEDFLVGGLAVALQEEIRLHQGQYDAWSAIATARNCENSLEVNAVSAYATSERGRSHT